MDERLLKGSLEEDDENLKNRIWIESKKIWTIATPGIVSRASIYGLLVVTQSFIGHISALDLASYALIQSLNYRFASGVIFGMSSATETLCGQAFGAGQNHMMGIYLQRSWIINLITVTMLLPLFIFAAPIFKLLGETTSLSDQSENMAIWFIPIVYILLFISTLDMYLQAQIKNKIVAWISASSFIVHLILSWSFVMKLNLGVPGAMCSLIMSNCLIVLGVFVYVFGGWCPHSWKGFTIAAFYGLWPMAKLSISSGMMLCLELWYTSILVLVAGYMKNSDIAISAFSICLNISAMQFMLCLGFLSAACVRVSNELGRGDAKAAKFAIKVTMGISVTLGLIVSVTYLIFSRQMAYVFTNEKEVIDVVHELSWLLAFTLLSNSMFSVLTGTAVGAGLQSKVAIINLFSYYAIGVPFGVILAYMADLRVQGLWIGMLSGIVVQVIMLGLLTWKTDWDEQVNKASERLNRWSGKRSDESD